MLRAALLLPLSGVSNDRYFTWSCIFFEPSRLKRLPMGCLPVPLFFLIGFGIGYFIDGQHGALWGAGIGLVIGLIGMVVMIKAMRGSDGR